MKQGFSKNTTEVFTKTIFHYVPDILKYIDEIKDPRKRLTYTMRYLIMSEMLMFLSEGRSQRFTETAYTDTEIYTNVFSRIDKKEIEKLQYKINYGMIRNKIYEDSKVLGKYNLVIDASRFQKAHYEVSEEWLKETKEGKTTWYISMLEMKIVANSMAVSLMSEMIRNEDKKKENETEEEIENKSIEEVKQDCELNAAKRMIPRFRKMYPRLPVRIIGDSLYPLIGLIELCEKENIEYIFVLKDKKIPTVLTEFLTLVSLPTGNREI